VIFHDDRLSIEHSESLRYDTGKNIDSPPAANGTTILTVRSGKFVATDCAEALGATNMSPNMTVVLQYLRLTMALRLLFFFCAEASMSKLPVRSNYTGRSIDLAGALGSVAEYLHG
jgi:hypothetical protein